MTMFDDSPFLSEKYYVNPLIIQHGLQGSSQLPRIVLPIQILQKDIGLKYNQATTHRTLFSAQKDLKSL